MADIYDARFDQTKTYTKEEFLFRWEVLLASVPPIDELHQIILDNIEWTKNHPDDYLFGFNEAPDGTVYPFARAQAFLPTDPPETPE